MFKFINWFWDEFVYTKTGVVAGWIWFIALVLALIVEMIILIE